MTLNNLHLDQAAGGILENGSQGALPAANRVPVDFIGETAEDCGQTHADAARILAAADAILVQGEALLATISSDNYTEQVPAAFNASIGGHYRHCLDHFTSLLRGLDESVVNYDHRERDRRIESDLAFALELTARLREALAGVTPSCLSRSLQARCEVSYDHGDAPVTHSSLGRELVYAIAHAIHHYALISIMARLLKADLPENFGVAPSTVNHLKSAANG